MYVPISSPSTTLLKNLFLGLLLFGSPSTLTPFAAQGSAPTLFVDAAAGAQNNGKLRGGASSAPSSAAAAVGVAAAAGDAGGCANNNMMNMNGGGGGQMALKVTVKNTANQQPLSPSIFVLHNDNFKLFTVGKPSSEGMGLLAETGDPKPIAAAVKGNPGIMAMALTDAPVFPGNTTTVMIPLPNGLVQAGKLQQANLKFSFAGMLINTNDAYAGIDAFALNDGAKPMTASATSFDAGTEENNELCSSIPGPACTKESGNVRSGNGEGIVTSPHKGILGINVGKNLDPKDLGADGKPLDRRFTFCGNNVGDITMELVKAD